MDKYDTSKLFGAINRFRRTILASDKDLIVDAQFGETTLHNKLILRSNEIPLIAWQLEEHYEVGLVLTSQRIVQFERGFVATSVEISNVKHASLKFDESSFRTNPDPMCRVCRLLLNDGNELSIIFKSGGPTAGLVGVLHLLTGR